MTLTDMLLVTTNYNDRNSRDDIDNRTNNDEPRQPQLSVMDNTERNFLELKYLPTVFLYQTCVSVIKTARGASVRASQSSLELDIYSAKVPYIARELFGVIIQIEHGRLHLRLDSGANATFNSLKLAGAEHKTAKRILRQLYSAICSDAHFVLVFERGEVLISYITLEVKGDATDNSCLCIQGNASSISGIASQL